MKYTVPARGELATDVESIIATPAIQLQRVT